MEDLVKIFESLGYHSQIITLSGHQNEVTSFNLNSWLQEIQVVLHSLHTEDEVILCGYSLGGLLWTRLLADLSLEREKKFKAFLIAPSIHLRKSSELFIKFCSYFPQIRWPSFSRKMDRVHHRLSSSYYLSLDEQRKAVLFEKKPIQVRIYLVLIHHDELVHSKMTLNFYQKNCEHLNYIWIKSRGGGSRHMGICPESLGDSSWKSLQDFVIEACNS